MSRVASPRPRSCGATQRLCSSQQSPQVHPLMPATIVPASRTKIANSTSSPSPVAIDASERMRSSKSSTSSGSGWSSTSNSTETESSDADDLLDHREVVEISPVRADPSLTEVGDADASELQVASRCFQHDILVQYEWARVIGFDQPLGVHPVPHLVDGTQQDHDVRERDV